MTQCWEKDCFKFPTGIERQTFTDARSSENPSGHQNETQVFNTDVGIIRQGKITTINMLRALMGKVDNTQEQMGDGSRDGNSKKDSTGSRGRF